MIRKIEIVNKMGEIEKIADFVDQIGEELHLSMAMVAGINLALEEAIANVIMYAYPKKEEKEPITLIAEYKDNELDFILSDKGVPFDPTKAPEADVTLPVEERPIGGLGIFLIRKIMGEVSYQRIDGENKLKMTKKLDGDKK
jgi:anti-sigma regulatory factor (Ser/Thr protein kinase)